MSDSRTPASGGPGFDGPGTEGPDTEGPGDTQPIDPIDLPPRRSARSARAQADVRTGDTAVIEPLIRVSKGIPVDLSDVRAPRRRRRWPWLVAFLVFLTLLVLAFIALDGMARDFARDQIRSHFVSTLDIDPATPVSVELGSGSIILQGLSGRFDSVDITASKLTIGSLSGSAVLHATGVPIDSKKSVDSLAISFTVPESGVAALAGNLDGIDLQSVVLEKNEILAAGTVSRFGFTLQVGLGFTPSAENGQLQLAPTSVQVNGTSYTTGELQSSPTFGPLVGDLLAPRTVCIADRLPASLTLTGVAVAGDALVLSARADDAKLGALGTRGTCPGGDVL